MTLITTELLEALLSSGPSRKEAELTLNSLDLTNRIQGLVSTLSCTSNNSHILIASVLLRRDIATLGGQALEQKISPNVARDLLVNVVAPLLNLFQSFPFAPCRRQVGYCLTEVICSLSLLFEQDCQTTLESILNTIHPLCRNADAVSLVLLANLAERCPNVLCKTNPDFIGTFQAALGSCNTPDSLTALTQAISYVAIATQVATSGNPDAISFASATRIDHTSVDANSPAAQLGSACLAPLFLKIKHATQEAVQVCLEHFGHVASNCPSLFAGDVHVFQGLVQTCLNIASSKSDLALASCQVLASLCVVGAVKRRILPSQPAIRDLIQNNVLRICAEIIVTGVDDDVQEWALEPANIMDDVPTWEEDDAAIYAESLLSTFLQSLGGTQTLPVVLPMVETLLSNKNDWKQQRAALSILEQCLFAAPVTFAQYVPVAVETALELAINSENLRVQFQAVILLGALCEADSTLDRNIRAQYGARILQVLAQMVQSKCSKIAAVACLSLVSYCRGGGDAVDGATLVVPFLKELLMALVTGPLSWDVSEPGAVAVKIRAIGAVACLAQSSEDAFCPFYSDVMPGLLGCTQFPSPTYEMSRLRGSAMEAATIVGQAVSESNRELYVGDAEKITHMAMPMLQTDDSAGTSIPMDELLSACARIASVMGEQYAPFVGVVLPHLLARVSAPPDMEFSEGDEAGLKATKRGDAEMNEDEEGAEHMTFTLSLPGKGITKVTVNTTKILEKAQAARAIYEHAAALGDAFGPFAETTLEALVPLVGFRYSAEVRSTVAQAISPVYEAACSYGEASGMQVPQKYLPLLAESLSKQIVTEDPSDPEVMFAIADSMSDVFYVAYRTLDGPTGRQILVSYTPAQAKSAVERIMKAMVACLRRRADLLRILEGLDGSLSGEDENEEYSRALQGEQEVLTPLVDIVGYTIKFLGSEAVPVFDSAVAPVLAPYLKEDVSDTRARFAAICLFDDVVEHCGSTAAAKYAPYLLEGALLGMDYATNGQDVELKQVSVYGIAQIARYAPATVVISQAERLVNMLVNICDVPKDATDHVALVENSASALASLALIGSAPLGKSMNASKRKSILSKILDQLPLREDESEAKIIHAGLCDLVEQRQVLANVDTERLLRIIGEIFACICEGEDLASPDTRSRLAKILFQMQSDVPGERLQTAFSSLPQQSQQCVTAVMSEFQAQSGANLVSP